MNVATSPARGALMLHSHHSPSSDHLLGGRRRAHFANACGPCTPPFELGKGPVTTWRAYVAPTRVRADGHAVPPAIQEARFGFERGTVLGRAQLHVSVVSRRSPGLPSARRFFRHRSRRVDGRSAEP